MAHGPGLYDSSKNPDNKEMDAAKPAISLCMIVKNEEKHLERCLESVRSCVDEIVIVDTGSTDGTTGIAGRYTDKLYFHPWENSFSKARNLALRYASGDWIFQVDADEELVSEDIPKISRAIQDRDIDAVMVQIVSKMRNGRSEGVHCVERIFRNNGVIHYEGRVHNRLTGVEKAKVFPIRLIHYGYDLDPEASRRKFKRTVSLLNMDLEDDPDNPITHHYLGCSYLTQGMFVQGLEASLKAIQLSSTHEDPNLIYIWSHYNAAMSSYKLKDFEQAEALCLKALGRCPNHVDSHFVLSLVYFDRGQWQKVISHGREYMRLAGLQEKEPDAFGNLVTCSLKEQWNIAALMGMAHQEINQKEEAEEWFQKAMGSAPEPFVVARAAGIFFYNKGLYDPALSYLEQAARMPGCDETVRRLLEEIHTRKRVCQPEPTITCCMIVKDEEAFLGQCLESVKDFVDEIVIVDTGSTDGTVDIARRFTDEVYFHPWEGSFSKARNQALAYATGDWIFQIDGDEELLPGSGERLREAVRNAGEADAVHVNIISTYCNGTRRARHNFERLFRNNGVIRYEGIVHNRVVGARSIKASRIELMHYGYDVDEKKAHEKFLRTTGLLKKQIAEDPDNPMPHHYLGVSYLSRGMNQEAAAESALAVELAGRKGDEHPIYIWARRNAAMAFFRMGDLDKARDYSLDALRKYPDHLDSYHLLSMVAAEKGEWNHVLTYGENYLRLREIFEINPEKAGLVINETMNEGPAVHLLIGHARYTIGDIPAMEKEYQTAADLSEDKWQAWWNAGCFHLDRTGDLDLAERYFNAAIKESPEQQDIWYMLAKLNNKKGFALEEERCLRKIRDLGTRDPVIINRLATLCMDAGRTGDAINALEALIELDPSDHKALCRLGKVHQDLDELEKAIRCFQKAAELSPEDPGPWFHLGEISLKVGRLSEARVFFERVVEPGAYELPAQLYLCEIELRENRFVEFVNGCDRLLKDLGLNRERVIDSLYDMLGVVEEIGAALRDRPRLGLQVQNILALLGSRLKVLSQAADRGRVQELEEGTSGA